MTPENQKYTTMPCTANNPRFPLATCVRPQPRVRVGLLLRLDGANNHAKYAKSFDKRSAGVKAFSPFSVRSFPVYDLIWCLENWLENCVASLDEHFQLPSAFAHLLSPRLVSFSFGSPCHLNFPYVFSLPIVQLADGACDICRCICHFLSQQTDNGAVGCHLVGRCRYEWIKGSARSMHIDYVFWLCSDLERDAVTPSPPSV